MANTIPAVPGEGSRTQYTAIVTAVVNVIAILVETFLGVDIPADVWIAANTILGSAIAIFLGDKVARTEEAAKQAVAGQPKEGPQGPA